MKKNKIFKILFLVLHMNTLNSSLGERECQYLFKSNVLALCLKCNKSWRTIKKVKKNKNEGKLKVNKFLTIFKIQSQMKAVVIFFFEF